MVKIENEISSCIFYTVARRIRYFRMLSGFHSIRGTVKRGGFSVFMKDNIDSDTVDEFSFINDEIEICTVSIRIGDCKNVIASIYRLRYKHDNIKQFSKQLKSMLQNRTLEILTQFY